MKNDNRIIAGVLPFAMVARKFNRPEDVGHLELVSQKESDTLTTRELEVVRAEERSYRDSTVLGDDVSSDEWRHEVLDVEVVEGVELHMLYTGTQVREILERYDEWIQEVGHDDVDHFMNYKGDE